MAVSKVFATQELPELILTHVDNQDLRTSVPRVSKSFRDAINASIKPRRELMFTADQTGEGLLFVKGPCNNPARVRPIDHCPLTRARLSILAWDRA